MIVYTQEEVLDITLGEIGTPDRDDYECQVSDYLEQVSAKDKK